MTYGEGASQARQDFLKELENYLRFKNSPGLWEDLVHNYILGFANECKLWIPIPHNADNPQKGISWHDYYTEELRKRLELLREGDEAEWIRFIKGMINDDDTIRRFHKYSPFKHKEVLTYFCGIPGGTFMDWVWLVSAKETDLGMVYVVVLDRPDRNGIKVYS